MDKSAFQILGALINYNPANGIISFKQHLIDAI